MANVSLEYLIACWKADERNLSHQAEQRLIRLAVAENERLQSRVVELNGHLDWVGWSSEGVVEARAEVERLQAALDEVQTVLQTTSQSGMWRVLKAMAILEAAESAGDPPCKP